MKRKKLNFNTIQSWSYLLMFLFLGLGFINPIWGLLGFICMLTPLALVFRGYGNSYCSHICPRGSFLNIIGSTLSIRKKTLPKWIKSNTMRWLIVIWMMGMMTLAIYNYSYSYNALGNRIYTIMLMSSSLGLLLSLFYQPRAWCQICPMKQITTTIDKIQRKSVH